MRKFAKSKILIWKNQKMIVVKMGGYGTMKPVTG
jgi:hypothetical protein